jgi:hypothetical protein
MFYYGVINGLESENGEWWLVGGGGGEGNWTPGKSRGNPASGNIVYSSTHTVPAAEEDTSTERDDHSCRWPMYTTAN